MRINSYQSSQNKNYIVSNRSARSFVRTLANPDALTPTVLLETSVTGGRGYNEYKRSGINGLRERAFDDILAAIFWMKGVDIFNSIGNKLGKRFLNLPTTEFDMGKDALRKPFENLAEDISKKYKNPQDAQKMQKTLARFKLGKIVCASLISTAFVGFALPKINQGITKFFMSKEKKNNVKEQQIDKPSIKNTNLNIGYVSMEDFNNEISNKNKLSFRGKIETVAHYLENNKVCKLLTSDVGLTSGRVITARNPDEGLEFGVRDALSAFFYTASTPLIYLGLQKATNSTGLTSIDPVASKQLNKHLLKQIEQVGDSINAEEFKKKALGVIDDVGNAILEKLPFEQDVISFNKLDELIKNKDFVKTLNLKEGSTVLDDISKKALEMSKLQPKQAGVGSVLTRQQVQDVLKDGSITSPKFMKAMYYEHFGDKLIDRHRFIPMKKITKFRDNIDDYVNAVVKEANKKNGGVVTKDLLNKVNKKSFALSTTFRVIALGISALALGFAIPKIQYAITKYRTGSSAAPGLREYESDTKKA